MPVRDGYEIAQNLRRKVADNGLRRTPIIAVTSSALDGDSDKCLANGMDDFIPNPLT